MPKFRRDNHIKSIHSSLITVQNVFTKEQVDYELPHVIFQSYTLGHFKESKWLKLQRQLLMRAANLAVWTAYGKVFRAAGLTYSKFKQENLGYLRQSEDIAECTPTRLASDIVQ